MSKVYDLVIIGGGSAGYSAALTALNLKKSVCMIEKGPFGGLCILKGCMPSKTLIHSARVAETIQHADEFGIQVNKKIKINTNKIINRKNRIIQGFAHYRKISANKHKNLDLVDGLASFVSKKAVMVDKKIIKGNNFLISTGSSISVPPIEGLKETKFITSDEALDLKNLPKSLAVLGGGPVALELSYYFHSLGVKVAIIQRSNQILSESDKDCAKSLEEALQKKGIMIYTNTNLKKFSKSSGKKKIVFDHGKSQKTMVVDEILAAFGRQPNIKKLNLESIGVKVEKGTPVSNKYLQTSIDNIYVAGDSSGNLPVVNVAVEEGRIAALNMFSKKQTVDYNLFPMAVFTHPEYAWIGVTEKKAKDKKLKVNIGKFPYSDLGKAETIGETGGFIKFITNKNGKILGVSIVGHQADNIIHEALPLLYFNATLQDLKKMPHLHPSIGEIYSYLVDEMV